MTTGIEPHPSALGTDSLFPVGYRDGTLNISIQYRKRCRLNCVPTLYFTHIRSEMFHIDHVDKTKENSNVKEIEILLFTENQYSHDTLNQPRMIIFCC